MSRECGDCSMCCKVLHVRELNKPANVWCNHCNNGCTIYSSRPQVCKDFECMWLQEESMPEEMKPNKSHCVLWVNTDGSILLVSVDPNYPDAYNHGKMREFLDYQLAHVPNAKIGIIVGAHKFPLLPEESFPMEDGFSLPEGLEGVRGMPSPDFVGNSFTYKYTPTEEIDGFKNNLFRILP